MKKTSKSIFSSLVKKYITFVLIVIVSIVMTAAFILIQINSVANSGQAPKITTNDIIRAEYENMNIDDVKAINGWVEILDDNLNVIYVKGNKQDDYQHYTQKDIINVLNMDSHEKYLGVMQSFKSVDGQNLLCLVKYPSDMFRLELNMTKAPYETGSIIYDNLVKGVLLFLFLSITNIILFSKWTSRKINQPLKEITNGITQMALGDYNTKIEFDAEKEFALIRDSFNSMVLKLKNAEDEKVKIQQSKMQMLADLSHDIKTPLTTIQGFSKALSEGLITDDVQKHRYYNTIYNKGERVSELIDDMSEFINLESIDYKLSVTKTDFCEFTRNVITDFYDEIEEKNFELVINIPTEEIFISFDQKLLNRALSNIISNSLKYNSNGTRLRVNLKETPNVIHLEIGDNGSGIPNHIKDNLFDPFVRGDLSRKSDGGTGLGLAIAKKIIEAHHHGCLEFYSDIYDEKTTFIVTLDKSKFN